MKFCKNDEKYLLIVLKAGYELTKITWNQNFHFYAVCIVKHEQIIFQLVSFWYRICIQPLQCAYSDKAFHIVNKTENYCTLYEFVVSTGWTDGYAGNVKIIGIILYVNLLW